MKSCTAIVAAAAMLQGAMAQGAEEKPRLGPNLDGGDIARQATGFANACRQNSVGQEINGTFLPFPCNAEVQIKNRCDKEAKNVEEMKECLCRKNTDKQPSAFFEVAQACVSCGRCNRFLTITGGEYYSGLFNRVEEKFCSPENTQTYDAIIGAEDTGMPQTYDFGEENRCVNKTVSILDYAKPEIQPWDAGGRFAKEAKDVNAPQAPWGNTTTNGTTDGNKGGQEQAGLNPVPGSVPVTDQAYEVCTTVLEEGKYADICFPLFQTGCTVGGDGMTCSEATLRPDLANRKPSKMSIDWSLNITFAFADPYTFPDCNCEPLPRPEKIEGNVIKGSNITVSDTRAENIVRNEMSVNIQNNIQIDIQMRNIFQQCPVCKEVKEVKEAPEQPKTAPAQPGPAPSTPNKQTSAQPDEEDLSCEPEDVPTGGQAGSQPPVTNNDINVKNEINIQGGGPSPGPSGPGNNGTAPNPSSKGIAPGPEPQAEGGPALPRPERAASEGEAPKKPMPSGVTPPGSPGNDGVAPAASQGKPGVSVSTETTTTTSSRKNGTAMAPSCKGPSCAAVMVNGAGAFRASVMAAVAAVLVAAL